MINVLITGSSGFVGKNLMSKLTDNEKINITIFEKNDSIFDLYKKILVCDSIVHLAAINRSKDNSEFFETNYILTKIICNFINENKLKKSIVYISSIHDTKTTSYGLSKKLSIDYLKKFSLKNKNLSVLVLRLSRVFGKWSKPNYNSVVATFCYSINNNIKANIRNINKKLDLNYIDDVVNEIEKYISFPPKKSFLIKKIFKRYDLTTAKIFKILKKLNFKNDNSDISGLGDKTKIDKYLYTTFMSFLPENKIKKKLKTFKDKRGSFTEVLKTSNDGQFSFFTCVQGEIRGNHFHNSKVEKFLVVRGRAEFKMKDLYSDKIKKFILDDKTPELLSSIPGQIHNITNIGKEKLVVFVWANEVFDKKNPDTIRKKI